jgi:outer membrane protein, heavy metal efflux system
MHTHFSGAPMTRRCDGRPADAPPFGNRRRLFHPVFLAAALVGLSSLPLASQAISFADAVALAQSQSPGLSAQQLQIAAAASAQGAAAALPDPKLAVGVENLPVSGMDRWSLTRDFMTMQRVAVMQEVPNAAKREARLQTARARTDRERAVLVVQQLQLQRDFSLAWIAARAAEQRKALLEEQMTENQRLQDSLPARIAGGGAQPGDLLMARQEALSLKDRQDELSRDGLKARSALRRWLGARADEPLQDGPPPLRIPLDQLRSDLLQHAELSLYPAMHRMAQAETREADAESRGDWGWEVAYSRRGRQWGDMVSVQLTFDLPWQKERRQQPQIRAKQLEMQRVEAEQEEAVRRHLQELDDTAAELSALDRQIERLTSTGIGLSQERAALALSSYQSAKGDLGSVLGARIQVLETRMRLIDLTAQREGLVAQLNSLRAQ